MHLERERFRNTIRNITQPPSRLCWKWHWPNLTLHLITQTQDNTDVVQCQVTTARC